MDKETEEKTVAKYESAEDAYNAAAKAVNVEDTVEALAYLRDTVNTLTATLNHEKEVNEGLTARVTDLTDKLSAAMLSVPIGDGPAEDVVDEENITVEDLLA